MEKVMDKLRGILDSCTGETRGIDQGVGNRTGTGMEEVTRCAMEIVSALIDGPCGLRFFISSFPFHIVPIFHFFGLREGIYACFS
jgi:hypothetical protein